MKQLFVPHRFSEDSQRIVAAAERIFDSYAQQGYDLTLRQLYYQFIAKDLFPDSWIDEDYNREQGLDMRTKNTEKNYKNFGGIISDARLAGLLDWDVMKDRGRELIEVATWEDPAAIVRAAAHGFRVDLWKRQPVYVEVMVEKQALEGVLIPICDKLGVSFIANKGYSSSSALYEAGQRMEEAIDDEKRVVVIYLGDHDPSGIDMTRDVEERLCLFAGVDGRGSNLRVHRVALNMDQIKKYRPPTNPAKMTDSRAADYVAKFGNKSWELDALNPEQLAELVRSNVLKLVDNDLWNEDKKREDKMKAELLAFCDGYGKKKKK